MNGIEIFLLLCLFIIVLIWNLIPKSNNKRKFKSNWVDTDIFQREKLKIQPNCSRYTFISFMNFIKSYRGGYVKRRRGEIVFQDYLGNEKVDLKGIFYNIVVPNHNLSVSEKEEFRRFMISIGGYRC